ncbi:MAG: AI-2E family transporter [Pseudomonadota bacterium]
MSTPDRSAAPPSPMSLAVDIAVRLSIIALLGAWCFQILRPFVTLMIWGTIIAVAYFPLCTRLAGMLGGRMKLAAAVMTATTLVVLILPGIPTVDSLVKGVAFLNDRVQNGELKIPPPPEGAHRWPIIGTLITDQWAEASLNAKATLSRYAPQIKALSLKLLDAAVSVTIGVIQFAAAILIAGILMAHAKQGGEMVEGMIERLAGARGPELVRMITVTIRNVVKGILGVAVIQGLAAGIGFMAAGVPGAGVWAFISLMLAIIQIGIGPVAIPVIIYMFSHASALTAGLLTAWLIVVMLSDNVLKPILLGRGAPVPMLVIFLGAIGGFMAMGFVGLFVGAVVLSLGFTLLLAWRDAASGGKNTQGACVSSEKIAAD